MIPVDAMSENDDGDPSPTADRRTALKTIGASAAVVAGGTGLSLLSSSAAASTVNVTATAPQAITNDRGDVSRVTVNPTFSVEWNDFDQAVGKVFYLVEAKVGSGDFWPIFRSTPWLTPGSLDGVSATKPGTTGSFALNVPLGTVMKRAVDARSDPQRVGTPEWPNLPLPRPLTVADERGRPDYGSFDYNSTSDVTGGSATSYDTYINGNSIGGTPYAMIETVNQPNVDEDPLVLANHFPGALSGLYGAASGTDPLDADTDGETKETTVTLRYTFAFYSINSGTVQYFTANDFSSYADAGEAIQNDPHLEHVRQSDVEEDGGGNSVLVMNNEDGYPNVVAAGANTAASKRYGALRNVADDHPAVISTKAAFKVTVTNEGAGAGATGSSNTGATGGGQ
jgi:hypothetical protein